MSAAGCCFGGVLGREGLFGWAWQSLGAKPCCWPGSGEGVKRGREMAALPSLLWPEAMPGVCVGAKSSKKWQC